MNKTINPFLSALKRLKDTFVVSSKEADELVREAEVVCRPSYYDQKLEKKLNLCLGEETGICLDRVKEEIETFSLALTDNPELITPDTTQTESYSTPLIEKDEDVPVACKTDTLYTASLSPEDDSSARSLDMPADIPLTPQLHIDSDSYTSPLHTDQGNPQSNYISDVLVNDTQDINCLRLSDEMDKLRKQFAEEMESIMHSKTVFHDNQRSVAALKIQTYWRGYQMQKIYYPVIRDRYNHKIHCIIKLQSFYKRRIAMNLYKQLVNERNRQRASVVIQNWWRVHKARVLLNGLILAKQLRQEKSAVLIQSMWRMYQCRTRYRKLYQRRILSAICLQTYWRGYVCRKMYSNLLLEIRKQENDRISEEIIQTNTQQQEILCNIIQEIESTSLTDENECSNTVECIDTSITEAIQTESYLPPIQMYEASTITASQELCTDIVTDPISSLSPPGHDNNIQIIFSSLEELRLNWLKQHTLWQFSCFTRVLSKKIPADPVPAHYKSLSDSQLTGYTSPNIPLSLVTKVDVNEIHFPVDLNCLAKVPNLLTLSLSRCPAVSLEGLQHTPSLTEVSLRHCSITTANFKGLQNIHFIDMSHNRVSALRGVVENSRVIECVMSNNRLVQLGEILNFTNLRRLCVDKNLLVRGEGLTKLRSLLELSCTHNHLSELPHIPFSPLLLTVDLSGNNLKTICMLYHPLLTVLRLDDNSISELDPLLQAYLPSLRTLTLNGNSVSSLHSFSALVMLERLEMKHNFVDNLNTLLECLGKNYYLRTLELEGNPVTQEVEYVASIERVLTCIDRLDSREVRPPYRKENVYRITRNGFVEMLERQLEERERMQTDHCIKMTDIENSTDTRESLTTRIQLSCDIYKLAIHHLREHEYYGTDTAAELLEIEATHDSISSILVIQSYTRGYLARIRYRRLLVNTSAIVIQKYWRGLKARREYSILLREVKTAVVVIQAYFRGWWVRSRLLEALRSLEDMNESEGEDMEQLCVTNWGGDTFSNARIELPKTPMGFYDEIMQSYIVQDTQLHPSHSNCTSAELLLPTIHHPSQAGGDKNPSVAWPSRNSTNTSADSRTGDVTNESSRSSLEPVPSHKSVSSVKDANDPWFLNNEQSIALFNKRSKKFKQGMKKKEERDKLQDPLKRLQKLQTGYNTISNSPKKRITPLPSRHSSSSLSSHDSSVDLIFKWSNVNQKAEQNKQLKSDITGKGNFLPRIPSRVRAGYSPQFTSDIDPP